MSNLACLCAGSHWRLRSHWCPTHGEAHHMSPQFDTLEVIEIGARRGDLVVVHVTTSKDTEPRQQEERYDGR